MTYYNEIDPFAAQWLANLAEAGEITGGEIDTRSIKEIQPGQLMGHTRAHFFAGIGGWDLALRLAGWPADRPVWTGSCPCQPYSAAGKQLGDEDPRNLWPDFRELIREYKPPTVFGEQVASKDGRLWLAGVRSDLEAMGYSVGAADLCAAGIGAPHIRQRLYWVADLGSGRGGCKDRAYGIRRMADAEDADGRTGERGPEAGTREEGIRRGRSRLGCADGWMADYDGYGLNRREEASTRSRESGERPPDDDRAPDRLANSAGERLAIGGDVGSHEGKELQTAERTSDPCGPGLEGLGNPETGGRGIGGDAALARDGGHVIGPGWSGFGIVACRDGLSRRFEPGSFPLAYGVPRGMGRVLPGISGMARSASRNRTGRLKGYGNAIVPGLAAEFIMAFLEATNPGEECA